MGHVHFFKYKDSFLPLFKKCIQKMFLMLIRWDILTERLGIRKKLFPQLLSLVNLTNWHPNIFWTLFLESASKTVLIVKKLVVKHVILKTLVKKFYVQHQTNFCLSFSKGVTCTLICWDAIFIHHESVTHVTTTRYFGNLKIKEFYCCVPHHECMHVWCCFDWESLRKQNVGLDRTNGLCCI